MRKGIFVGQDEERSGKINTGPHIAQGHRRRQALIVDHSPLAQFELGLGECQCDVALRPPAARACLDNESVLLMRDTDDLVTAGKIYLVSQDQVERRLVEWIAIDGFQLSVRSDTISVGVGGLYSKRIRPGFEISNVPWSTSPLGSICTKPPFMVRIEFR
jgi:hypothetical protein